MRQTQNTTPAATILRYREKSSRMTKKKRSMPTTTTLATNRRDKSGLDNRANDRRKNALLTTNWLTLSISAVLLRLQSKAKNAYFSIQPSDEFRPSVATIGCDFIDGFLCALFTGSFASNPRSYLLAFRKTVYPPENTTFSNWEDRHERIS